MFRPAHVCPSSSIGNQQSKWSSRHLPHNYELLATHLITSRHRVASLLLIASSPMYSIKESIISQFPLQSHLYLGFPCLLLFLVDSLQKLAISWRWIRVAACALWLNLAPIPVYLYALSPLESEILLQSSMVYFIFGLTAITSHAKVDFLFFLFLNRFHHLLSEWQWQLFTILVACQGN